MAKEELFPLENNYIDMTDEKLIEIIQSEDSGALECLISNLLTP